MAYECPLHRENDGSPLKAIFRDHHGYYYCYKCLWRMAIQWREQKDEIDRLKLENEELKETIRNLEELIDDG